MNSAARGRVTARATSLLGAVLMCSLLQLTPVGSWLENRSLDLRFRLRSANPHASPVTMVVLRGDRIQQDERSLRQDLADLLESLAALKVPTRPKAVVIDIRLATAAVLAESGKPSDTQRILRDTAELGNVVHAFDLATEFGDIQSPEASQQLERHALSLEATSWDATSWTLPTALGTRAAHPSFGMALFQAAGGAGFTNVFPPTRGDDPTVYSLPLLAQLLPGGELVAGEHAPILPSLALAGVLQAQRTQGHATACENATSLQISPPLSPPLSLKQLLDPLPLDAEGRLGINHRPRFQMRLPQDGIAHDGLSSPSARSPAEGILDVILFHPCGEPGESIGETSSGNQTECRAERRWFSRIDGTRIPLEKLTEWLPCQVLLVVDGHEQNAVRSPLGEGYPQASLHAQVMSNLLEHDLLWIPPAWSGWLAGLGLVIVALFIRFLRRFLPVPLSRHMRLGRWRPLLITVRDTLWTQEAVLALSWTGTAIIALERWSLWLPVALPVGALVGSQVGWSWMTAQQVRLELQHISSLAKKHEQNILQLEQQRLTLEGEVDAQAQRRRRVEEDLRRARHDAEAAHEALEEARTWAQTAEEGRLILAERLEATLLRADTAEGLATRLQSELSVASDPADIARIEQALGAARDKADALRQEVRGLQQARQEARLLAELLFQTLEQALANAMRLSGKVAKPVARMDRVLSTVPGEQEARASRFLETGRELERGLSRLKHQDGADNMLEPDAATVAVLRARLTERQELYSAVLTHIQDVMQQAGQSLERVVPPEDSGPPTREEAVASMAPERRREKVKGLDRFITSDPELIRLIDKDLPKFAVSDLPVLILGETGTGKELIAQLLHEKSGRPGRLIPIACGAIPEALIEAELFGSLKGAYTGATRDKRGLFEDAHHGTLFLDEIGRLSLEMQGKLLRVLQDRRIRKVGSNLEFEVDFRLIAATSTPIEEQVRTKTFLPDLYFRLKGLLIQLPPLRERQGDILYLATLFLKKEATRTGKALRWTPEALIALNACNWKGNVRELEFFVASLAVIAPGNELDARLVWSQLDPKNASSERLEDFTAEEQARLAVLRRLDFNAKRCAEEGDYPGSKGTADKHIRILICKALFLRQWEVEEASKLLAGAERSALILMIRRRIQRFLGENLRQNLERVTISLDVAEATAAWEDAMKEQYRADYPLVKATIDALREGKIRGLTG